MTRRSTPVRGSHRSRREEGGEVREQKLLHVSVMPQEVLTSLDLKPGEIVIDATYGRGGHSALIKKAAKVKLLSIDADPASGADITGNFADITKLLKHAGAKKVDKVLFDLGWNREQLSAGKGFSFERDEPLIMSYGPKPRSGLTAAQMLSTMREQALADILYGYGEERYAKRIAARIVERRSIAPFKTTYELVEAVRDAVPASYRHGRLNPATKTFQALRIAVNDELTSLEKGLAGAWSILAPGGRIVVITFHSIEDRLVKNYFKKCGGRLIYKKPLTPSLAEIKRNPASRSAKLRVIEKI